ncbi:hypothetical protein J7K18_02315 [bacterium]|nr:hypothetical protein [bacterium]
MADEQPTDEEKKKKIKEELDFLEKKREEQLKKVARDRLKAKQIAREHRKLNKFRWGSTRGRRGT